MTVVSDCATRLVGFQDHLDRGADLRHAWIVEAGLSVDRGVPGSQQQKISLAQWHVEHVRERQKHPPAGLRPAGLKKADVTGGNLCLQRQLELAQMARFTPSTQ